eukprot:COSAG01_NODE_13401_length_1591_cov_0.839142_1_plen_273_part_00
MGAVEALPGGAPELDGLAMRELTKWALGLVRRMVAARRDPETGALLQQEQPLEEVGQLARVLKDMGEVDAARKLFEEVIEGQTAQLGGSHTSTLNTKSNMALLLEGIGEVDAARKLYEEVIEGHTAQLGGSHTSTLRTRTNFAALLAYTGDAVGSKAMMDELLVIATEHHGSQHPMTQQIARLASQVASLTPEPGTCGDGGDTEDDELARALAMSMEEHIASPPPADNDDGEARYGAAVAELVSWGFERARVLHALEASGGDQEVAANMLLG